MIQSKNILKVIDNFKKVLPMAKMEGHLNMAAPEVNCRGHICGTVHCHGGWYAVAACSLKRKITFDTGANKMARDLGFFNAEKLEDWMCDHPEIWGNSHAHSIFSWETAFYHEEKRPIGAENLQHIIDHWQEVYERLRALEQLQNTVSKEPEAQECDATGDAIITERWENKTSSFTKLIPIPSEVLDSIKEKV